MTFLHGALLYALNAVSHLLLQIDCVTVKGSNQPMGLFTYDITLERIASPSSVSQEDVGVDPTASGQPLMDVETYSMASYEQEFEEHPDLVKWALLPSCSQVYSIISGTSCVPSLIVRLSSHQASTSSRSIPSWSRGHSCREALYLID